MEVIMKKGIIITVILCLLAMIFLSGSIGVFYKPIEVSLSVVVAIILIVLIVLYLKYKKGK
jgi:hypothetical protein